ncbi:hypothetical protein Ddye_022715 [Dipteronia dyeriana]|uniref:YDG domain-containing protein n=1 Tax=Dipteronia dyeriana TaxID=168575 RepID=A0AAD9WSM4_9ROSI|nr:hypothetical protein Ddye_022715 [Dipteronia dyeriana]
MISLNMHSNQQVDGFSRKPKRPKVYAIRTFPEGCVAHECIMDLKENFTENSEIIVVNSHHLNETHSSINGVSRKPKRPKVYAIRTFPEGCGAHECTMDLKEIFTENSAIMVVNSHHLNEKHLSINGVSRKPKRPRFSAVHTFLEGCGEQECRMDLKENITENSTVMVVNCHHLEEKHSSIGGVSRKPKHPKVHAIRTFPEGCGEQKCRKDLKENITENSVVIFNNSHHLEEKYSSIDGVSRKPKCLKVDAIHTFPKGCGEQEIKIDLKENITENSAVMVVDSHHSEEKHSSIDGVSRKRKLLKVAASCTFPEGCAEQESRMDSKENIMENSAVMVVNSRHLVDTINVRTSPPNIISTTTARKRPPNPPSRILKELPSMANNKPLQVTNDFSRHQVKYALHLYQEMLSKLLQENVQDCQVAVYNGSRSRVDMMAAKFLKKKLKWINTNQRLGDIPGVQVCDVFEWMAELNVIGLHHQYYNGIDYMKNDGKTLATSIVASGRYANIVESSDVLIYSGHGGNPGVITNQPRDQKLERGNLALKNSMDAKTPVRVIRGFKFSESSNKLTSTSCKKTRYVYDGLYLVHDYWQEKGRFDKLVFMFYLKRISGQPKLDWPKQLVHL